MCVKTITVLLGICGLLITPCRAAVTTNAVKLTASDGFAGNNFGDVVGTSSNRLMICGATQAYVFERVDNTWTETAIVSTPNQEPILQAAISGDTIALLASGDFGNLIYLFTRVGSNWVQEATVERDPAVMRLTEYGTGLALDDDTLVVGAVAFDDTPSEWAVALVYERTNGTWTHQATVTPFQPGDRAPYVSTMALRGNLLVLGYPAHQCISATCSDPHVDCRCGAAYVFAKTGNSWVQLQKLVPPAEQPLSDFGWSVAIAGQTIFIGAPSTDFGGGLTNAGAVHIFTGDGASWSHHTMLMGAVSTQLFGLGYEITTFGNQFLAATHFALQEVHVFRPTHTTWTRTHVLNGQPPSGSTGFGLSVAGEGDTLVVGAPHESEGAGAAYVFRISLCQLAVAPLYQDDTRWKTNLYNHSTVETIGTKGCAMTSVSMALNFVGITNLTLGANTVTNTPATLNVFMKDHSNNFIGQNVNWAATVAAASDGKFVWEPQKLKSSTELTNALEYLEDIVCVTGTPVVVGVRLNAAGNPGHFLLVTGKDGDDFLITDPAGDTKKTLADYDNRFETRGHLIPVPAAPAPLQRSAFAATTASVPGGRFYACASDAVQIEIVDSLGRRAGMNGTTTNEVSEIPGMVQFFDSLDNDETGEPADETSHCIYIRQPVNGDFQIIAHPIKNGPVTIIAHVLDENGQLQPPTIVETNAMLGVPITFSVTVNTQPLVLGDLAVLSLKAPKKIKLSETKPPRPGKLSIGLQNLGSQPVTIATLDELETLLNLQIRSLGDCPPPVVTVISPATFPVILAPKQKLKIACTVAITCANDPLASSKTENHADYEYTVALNPSALGATDTQPGNDACPRPASGADKGCAKGLAVRTDVVQK